MKKITIMVDMDDVMCKGGLLYLINEFLGSNYREDDFNQYYMQSILPDKDEFFRFFLTKNLYDYCTLEDDVIEVMGELNSNYDLFIGTSYIFPEIVRDSGIILLHKYEYLQKHFPFISPYKYVFLSNKSLLMCDIKIDDKVDNLNGAETKLLYSAYHNLDLGNSYLKQNGIQRVNGWKDVGKILLKK